MSYNSVGLLYSCYGLILFLDLFSLFVKECVIILCVLLTFFKLLDASNVDRISCCATGYLPTLSSLWSCESVHILSDLWGVILYHCSMVIQ